MTMNKMMENALASASSIQNLYSACLDGSDALQHERFGGLR